MLPGLNRSYNEMRKLRRTFSHAKIQRIIDRKTTSKRYQRAEIEGKALHPSRDAGDKHDTTSSTSTAASKFDGASRADTLVGTPSPLASFENNDTLLRKQEDTRIYATRIPTTGTIPRAS